MNAENDLAILRASMLLEADPAAAAREAAAVLVREPGDEAAGLLLAQACRTMGDGARALTTLEGLAQANAESAPLQFELARARISCARGAEAVVALKRATDLDPTFAAAWKELSVQLLAQGEIAQADAAYLKHRRLATDPTDLGEAYVAFGQGDLDAAQTAVQKRLHAGTNEVAAFTLLAAIAGRRGDDFAEEGSLLEILRLAPCDNMARESLVRLLLRQGRTQEALGIIERLLLGAPQGAGSLLRVEALRLSECHAEGLHIIRGLIEKDPVNPELWLFAGNLERYMGDSAAAVESYRHALQIRPDYGAAYLALSNLKTYRFTADDIEAMQRGIGARGGTDDVDLHFALAKGLEDEERYTASFEHYELANRQSRAQFQYDAAAMNGYVQRFKSTFTADFFAQRAGWGIASEEPIFIIGLPRSGSTLLEQILASHSAVEGTRELSYIPTIARELAGTPDTAARYPEHLTQLKQSDVESLARRYLDSARAHRTLGRARFVDKMHGNFQSVALIHLMFPRASIIDSRRHPMATGFACFKQLFNPGMNFAYDLREFGLYYRDYVELLDHVEGVLPGRVHRVYYERMVADTEQQVRALLDYCRLPFEAACLKFHETRRVAQTISSEQVRRPIYADSVDQWRRFEASLGPLRSALGDAVERYDAPRR